MKKIITFFLLIFIRVAVSKAQVFPIDTILYHGNISNRVNFVILADGYTSSDLSHFKTDVTGIMNSFFATSPYKEYKNYINVFAIRVASQQSGAKHPKTASDCSQDASNPVTTANNYFGSTFDYGGIHRLLTVTNNSAISNVLSANFPQYDQVLVLVNSPYYGGAGGTYATFSLHSSAAEIGIHEAGHSFAKLADEYWAGAQYAAEMPNMTKETDPLKVKWSPWMNYNGVGIYSHSGDASWKKPHQHCKMEALGQAFCPVCIETHVEKIHSLVHPIDAYKPSSLNVNLATTPVSFSLQLVKPISNTLRTTWKLDNTAYASLNDSVLLDPSPLSPGTHTLTVTVLDTTPLVRITGHATNHIYKVEWIINKTLTGLFVHSNSETIEVGLYPNPVNDFLTVSYNLNKPNPVSVVLFDLSGKAVFTVSPSVEMIGDHQLTIPVRAIGLASGLYMLRMNVGGTEWSRKICIE